jgi:hypothetical protein
MVFTVENSSSRFGDHSVAGGTAVTLPTFARKSEFDDVEASDASIVRALLVPAKGARLFKLLGLGFLRTFPHAGNINNSKPGDHRETWEDEWRKFDRETREGIFAIAEVAQPKLRAFAESATPAQLSRDYMLTSRGGQTVRGGGSKFLTHIAFHSTRH